MLHLNKSYKNRKVSLTVYCKYKYFDSTVQRAEDRRQKFYFCRLPFAVNIKLNLSNKVFLSRNYRLIVAPRKFDVLKTNICPRSEASRANMLVLRTSNFQGATNSR